MKGPVEPVHRSVPETIQEVIELTGFLCFLFRSTPMKDIVHFLQVLFVQWEVFQVSIQAQTPVFAHKRRLPLFIILNF